MKRLRAILRLTQLEPRLLPSFFTTDYTGVPYRTLVTPGVLLSGKYVGTADHVEANVTWKVYLDDLKPIVGQKPSKRFMDTVTLNFPGYTWSYAPAPLADNSLVARTYQAIGIDATTFRFSSVGANINISYSMHGNDPLTVHWIQVDDTNWAPGDRYPNPGTFVDNLGAPDPFYDTLGAADVADFVDTPRVGQSIANINHFETWLVELVPPKQIVFLGGFTWGDTNAPPPTVTGLSANGGSIDGGNTITITGSGFLSTSQVTFTDSWGDRDLRA
jgi:IPT/TIG domain